MSVQFFEEKIGGENWCQFSFSGQNIELTPIFVVELTPIFVPIFVELTPIFVPIFVELTPIFVDWENIVPVTDSPGFPIYAKI